MSVDRSTLEMITKPADDFVDSFCDQIKLLIPHSFIAKQQSLYQTDTMLNLMPGHFLVICDFSENHSFVLQDADKHFIGIIHKQHCTHLWHTTKNQESCNTSALLLSDCLYHDTITVHLFQKHLVQFLQEKF